MSAKPQSRNLRRGRHSETGRIYHIRLACWSRERLFTEMLMGREVVYAMRKLDSEANTLCFVVMPDHVHWLMELKKGVNLSSVVQKLKSLVTKKLHQQFSLQGNIWQSGFFDRAIRRDEDLQAVARYIVMNPLRAGLVNSLRQYSLWDAVWL
ncbi:MAG: transposase [Gammaproteobacteria bacterium RIFCSPLOWO2_02_FULL_57_10]|nr:MAG: transposase [Gammaproteobacteria bacterium RIFCSPLOWO2_02_FULL_57_10]